MQYSGVAAGDLQSGYDCIVRLLPHPGVDGTVGIKSLLTSLNYIWEYIDI